MGMYYIPSPLELEMAEMERLLGKKLIDFKLSADFIELEFEGGRLIIEISEDGVLSIRVIG